MANSIKKQGPLTHLGRLGVGAAIALLSFCGLDWVSGGILGAPAEVAKVHVTVFLECTGLPAGVKPSFAASLSVRHPEDVQIHGCL